MRAHRDWIAVLKQCAILVGGLGTWLGTITQQVPKPLVDEAGRHGFEVIVLLRGYRSEQFDPVINYINGLGLRVVRSVEPAPAGTAGNLTYALDYLEETFSPLKGEGLFDVNLRDLTRPSVPSAARGSIL